MEPLFRHTSESDETVEIVTIGRPASGLPSAPSTVKSTVLARCSTGTARALLPYELAQKLSALPLALLEGPGGSVVRIAVALDTPEYRQTLRFTLSKEIETILVPDASELREAIFAAYKGDGDLLIRQQRQLAESARTAPPPRNQDLPFYPAHGEVATFLAMLIEHAAARNASDLHLVPERDGLVPRLRVDGELQRTEGPVCTLQQHAQLINRVKVLAQLDLTEQRRPQEGNIRMPIGADQRWIRVSLMPTMFGEKCVLRFMRHQGVLSVDDLAFDSRTQTLIDRWLTHPRGALLACGPTGSGKTSTLYALLLTLAARGYNVVTIEDPVEATLSGISQTCLRRCRALDYPAALKALLRQDPDVILIGEIRDGESALIALQAALSGHVVLSTLHAGSVREVVLRLQEFGAHETLIEQALGLICCQRLVPRLCPLCRVEDMEHRQLFAAKVGGCPECGEKGVQGRAVLVEGLFAKELQVGWLPPLAAGRTGRTEWGASYVALEESLRDRIEKGIVSVR